MGLKDKVLGALKKVGEATKKAVDKAKKELAYRKEVAKVKLALLERFNLKQLKQIAKEEGIALSYEDLKKKGAKVIILKGDLKKPKRR